MHIEIFYFNYVKLGIDIYPGWIYEIDIETHANNIGTLSASCIKRCNSIGCINESSCLKQKTKHD